MDSSIFPSFMENGNALESTYEAFRFTESLGVIFQCNVKYCIGKCEPVSLILSKLFWFSIIINLFSNLLCYDFQVICGVGRENLESWGRKRRSVRFEKDDEMTLSREILVLDYNEADAARSTMDPYNSSGKLNLKKMKDRLVRLVTFSQSTFKSDGLLEFMLLILLCLR